MRRLPFALAVGFLLLSGQSCRTVNREALAAWVAADGELVADLGAYRTAAGKSVEDLQAHLARPFGEVSKNEEAGIMAELLAYAVSDPAKSSRRKDSYATRIQAHLNLFNSLKGP